MGRAPKQEADRLAIGMHVAFQSSIGQLNRSRRSTVPIQRELDLTAGGALKTVCPIARVERRKSCGYRDGALHSGGVVDTHHRIESNRFSRSEVGQIDHGGELQFGGANLDLRLCVRDVLFELQIEETLGPDLSNRPRLKILALDLGHLALAIQSKDQCLGITLNDLDRQLNDLFNAFRSDLCRSLCSGGIKNRRLGQFAVGLNDDGPGAITTDFGADAGLARTFLSMTRMAHQARQAGES